MTGKKDKHGSTGVKQALKKVGLFLLGLLLVVNTIQLSRLGGIVESVDEYNKGVVDELGGLRSDVMTFASDMNEIRQFLLLPTKDYSVLKGGKEETQSDEKETSRTESAILNSLAKLLDEQTAAKNSLIAADTIKNISSSKSLAEKLTAAGLALQQIEDLGSIYSIKIIAGEIPVFSIIVEKNTGLVRVQSALGYHEAKGTGEKLIADLADYLTTKTAAALAAKNTISAMKSEIEKLPAELTFRQLLDQKKITLGNVEDGATDVSYSFLNSAQEKVLTISISRSELNLSFETNGKKFKSVAEMLPELKTKLENLDTSTSLEKVLAERQKELEKVLTDKSLSDMLTNAGLKVVITPRHEFNKLLYDVVDAGGQVKMSYVLELSSGMYKLIRDNVEMDLYSAGEDGSKKKS